MYHAHMPTVIGSNLRRLRDEAELNQSQLARLAGVDPGTVSRIEAGKRAKITPDVLAKLARALRAQVSDLTGDRNNSLDYEELDTARRIIRLARDRLPQIEEFIQGILKLEERDREIVFEVQRLVSHMRAGRKPLYLLRSDEPKFMHERGMIYEVGEAGTLIPRPDIVPYVVRLHEEQAAYSVGDVKEG